MVTDIERKIASKMRDKVRLLRKLKHPEKDIEKIIRDLNLPLGLQLNLLDTR